MTDMLGEALRAVSSGTPLAYPLVFVAGLATSVGPCTAPRYVAVAALAHASRRPARIIAAFVCGLAGAFVVLGFAMTSLPALWSSSRWSYAALTCALAIGGLTVLLRGSGGCTAHPPGTRAGAGLGGTFLLGASSALVVSPCCTPAIAAIAGVTSVSGRALEGSLLLAAFACGHALPLVAAGALGMRSSAFFARFQAVQASATISGALMLALAAYYGVLA